MERASDKVNTSRTILVEFPDKGLPFWKVAGPAEKEALVARGAYWERVWTPRELESLPEALRGEDPFRVAVHYD